MRSVQASADILLVVIGILSEGEIGLDADDVEGVPERHLAIVGPISRIGQGRVGALAHLGDERTPFLLKGQHAVEFGADDKAIGLPADSGQQRDPLPIVPQNRRQSSSRAKVISPRQAKGERQ